MWTGPRDAILLSSHQEIMIITTDMHTESEEGFEGQASSRIVGSAAGICPGRKGSVTIDHACIVVRAHRRGLGKMGEANNDTVGLGNLRYLADDQRRMGGSAASGVSRRRAAGVCGWVGWMNRWSDGERDRRMDSSPLGRDGTGPALSYPGLV